GPVAFAHQFGPQAATSSELGNLFKEVVMHVEEEGQTRGKLIDLEAAFERGIDIGQPIGDGEGKLLHGGSSCLADMVAANANGVPFWHIARAKLDGIDDQTHRWLRREEKLFLCAIFFQYIVLQRAT